MKGFYGLLYQFTEYELKKHDEKVRADAIDEFMDKLPYSAMVRMSTIKEIAEQLKEQK